MLSCVLLSVAELHEEYLCTSGASEGSIDSGWSRVMVGGPVMVGRPVTVGGLGMVQ